MECLGNYQLGTIVTGDALELARELPEECADLVVIDPPWNDDSLPLYPRSAAEAARILRPGGFLMAYLSKRHLPDYTNQMSEHLTWQWLLDIYQPNSEDRYFPLNTFPAHRPIGLWSKGDVGDIPQGWCPDAVRDTVKNKNGHRWGQPFNASLRYIEWLTGEGSVVVDFFCGGGLVPLICQILNLPWLAFEIDEETAQDARKRVAGAQPPLPLPRPVQLEMEVT